jgi:hypothetical protein
MRLGCGEISDKWRFCPTGKLSQHLLTHQHIINVENVIIRGCKQNCEDARNRKC